MQTLAHNYKAFSLIRPQTLTTGTSGTGVDLKEYNSDAVAVVDLGAASGTSATCTVTIQGSNDNSNWTTLTTFGTLTDTSDNKLACGRVDFSAYRYVRADVAIGGTTPSFTVGVTLLARANIGKSSINSTTAA